MESDDCHSLREKLINDSSLRLKDFATELTEPNKQIQPTLGFLGLGSGTAEHGFSLALVWLYFY